MNPTQFPELLGQSKTWIVTGGAGFIGSHIVDSLLAHHQKVVVIDNFATGHIANLDHAKALAAGHQENLVVHNADIRDQAHMAKLFQGADFVLHQAALGSVPRSIEDPWTSHDVNVNGFISVLQAARAAKISRVVFASSSSVYGDHPVLPKVEANVGNPMSPYAASKRTDEIYGQAFSRTYNMSLVGLRYFNVFGPRQDPNGPYAAVIPRWIKALLDQKQVTIFGDGLTSRDFCYVKNAVNANIKAALSVEIPTGSSCELNIACFQQTSLTDLFFIIRDGLASRTKRKAIADATPLYDTFRPGDVRHSLADIGTAKKLIGYAPSHDLRAGLEETLDWYVEPVRSP